MQTPLERAARAATKTLRHHGVELHPDDIRGVALDVLEAIREPSEAMKKAGSLAPNYIEDQSSARGCGNIFTAMLNTAIKGE